MLLAIARAYAACGIHVHFVHAFSCELVPKLRDWIMALFAEVGATMSLTEGCVFERAEEMGNKKAKCSRHDRHCEVPDSDVTIAGTSCKDFSRSTGHSHTERATVLEGATSAGGSAQTFHGLIGYLLHHLVTLLLFENVDTLDEAPDDHDGGGGIMTLLADVCQRFQGAGLSTVAMLTDPQLFGLPTERRRLYVLGANPLSPLFRRDAQSLMQKALAHVLELMRLCERTPPCVTSVLCCQQDDCVEAELAKRMAAGVKMGEYNVAPSIAHHTGRGSRWGDMTVLPEDTKQSPWYKTLSPSQKNSLLFSYTEKPDCIMRDINQSLSRIRYSKVATGSYDRHLAPCLMPSQVVWLAGHGPGQGPRLLLGREALRIQGYPEARVPQLIGKTPEATMMSIAGNMMSATVPLAILMAAFAALPWASEDSIAPSTTAAQCDDAMSLFAMVADGEGKDETPAEPSRAKKKRMLC